MRHLDVYQTNIVHGAYIFRGAYILSGLRPVRARACEAQLAAWTRAVGVHAAGAIVGARPEKSAAALTSALGNASGGGQRRSRNG